MPTIHNSAVMGEVMCASSTHCPMLRVIFTINSRISDAYLSKGSNPIKKLENKKKEIGINFHCHSKKRSIATRPSSNQSLHDSSTLYEIYAIHLKIIEFLAKLFIFYTKSRLNWIAIDRYASLISENL